MRLGSFPSCFAQPSRDRLVVFSDFDGTITTIDSHLQLLEALGVAPKRQKLLNLAVMNGTISLAQSHRLLVEDMASQHTYEEALKIARRVCRFDPGFRSFVLFLKSRGIPLVIVSSGLACAPFLLFATQVDSLIRLNLVQRSPVIRACLEDHLGYTDASLVRIIANEVSVCPKTGRFSIIFKHPDSPLGHVKCRAFDEYRKRSFLGLSRDGWKIVWQGNASSGGTETKCLFIGDSVSDISVAEAADLLFVKLSSTSDNLLSLHCQSHSIPHLPISSFHEVTEAVDSLLEGRKSIEELLGLEDGEAKFDEKEDDDWEMV